MCIQCSKEIMEYYQPRIPFVEVPIKLNLINTFTVSSSLLHDQIHKQLLLSPSTTLNNITDSGNHYNKIAGWNTTSDIMGNANSHNNHSPRNVSAGSNIFSSASASTTNLINNFFNDSNTNSSDLNGSSFDDLNYNIDSSNYYVNDYNLNFINNSIRNNFNSSIIDVASSVSSDTILRRISEKLGRGLSVNEVNMIRNQVILNHPNFHGNATSAVEEWKRQMEYDKFMNEIWIGIVLTLIVISLVFCICSCFLYHQFRHWKRSYRQNIQQNLDIESAKLNIEEDDPVPSYSLVSGLPSYDDALEQLQKMSRSRQTAGEAEYKSLYKVFKIEVDKSDQQHQHQQQSLNQNRAALLNEDATSPFQSESDKDNAKNVSKCSEHFNSSDCEEEKECLQVSSIKLNSVPSFDGYSITNSSGSSLHISPDADPFSCSNDDNNECNSHNSSTRKDLSEF